MKLGPEGESTIRRSRPVTGNESRVRITAEAFSGAGLGTFTADPIISTDEGLRHRTEVEKVYEGPFDVTVEGLCEMVHIIWPIDDSPLRQDILNKAAEIVARALAAKRRTDQQV